MGNSTPVEKARSGSRSTLPEDPGLPRLRRALWIRRLAVTVLFAFVGAGALGVFGVRSGSVTASRGGYELTVLYPKVIRPGLQSPWAFTVTREGGFGEDPITIATTHSWLDLFDENGRNPAPIAEYVDGDMLVWEFDPPLGRHVDVHVRRPARALGAVGADRHHAVCARATSPCLEVTYRTRVMP